MKPKWRSKGEFESLIRRAPPGTRDRLRRETLESAFGKMSPHEQALLEDAVLTLREGVPRLGECGAPVLLAAIGRAMEGKIKEGKIWAKAR